MKKSKIIPLPTEQQLNNQETIDSISKGLNSLESLSFNTPSQMWFESFVLEKQRLAKEKWRKELFLFGLIAIVILSGIVFSLYRIPLVFIILQVIGIATILTYSAVNVLKKVKNNEQ